MRFIVMIIGAYMISQIPFLHIPFSWMQTFFHEISHGLSAIFTGGQVVAIELNLDGSGLCTTRGGWSFFIAFAGYMGSVLWGAIIYLIVSVMKDKHAFLIALLIVALIIVSLFLWVRDATTFIALGIVLIPFVVALKSRSYFIEKYFLKFSGVYILLDAIKSPFVLLSLQDRGDDAALAEMTGIPQFIWVVLWVLIGVVALLFLYRISTLRR